VSSARAQTIGFRETNSGFPETVFGLPGITFGIPGRISGLPEATFGAPETSFGSPEMTFGSPEMILENQIPALLKPKIIARGSKLGTWLKNVKKRDFLAKNGDWSKRADFTKSKVKS
jgi:hypothetical protein